MEYIDFHKANIDKIKEFFQKNAKEVFDLKEEEFTNEFADKLRMKLMEDRVIFNTFRNFKIGFFKLRDNLFKKS